jgi:hypothetical protein
MVMICGKRGGASPAALCRFLGDRGLAATIEGQLKLA